MSLGRREARHQSVASVRTAGVTPEDYWSFKPGQKVMTADGFPGVVARVDDGPIAGTEAYEVTLDNGMGGGQYTASLLRAMPQSQASVDVKTAADDYPELGSILVDRPPLAMVSSKIAKDTAEDAERDTTACENCGGSGEVPDDDAGSNRRNDDPDYPNKACPDCEGGGRKTAAYDHGDPNEYTSGHKCPNCASDRSLESANGVIKCEDCGYTEQNGQKDGWGGPNMSPKAASVEQDHYGFLVTAAGDSEFLFHVTASYSDVRSKAKRLRSQGGVNIISAHEGTVVGNVKGDHHVYETEIVRMGSNAIAQWHCGCKWGAYAWGRSPAFKKFEGRLCSHALALHYEASSRGMFGKTVQEDKTTPDWLRPRTRVVVDFNKDDRKNVSRPAVPRKRDLMRTHALVQTEQSVVQTLVRLALAEGDDPAEIVMALAAAGIDGRQYVTAGENPKGPPNSHKKDRSGDLAPCSRGGCGHPEGIHGEDDGGCNSQGCECSHFQRAGSAKEARRKPKTRKKHKSPAHSHHGVHHWSRGHGGYFPTVGYGFGLGYGGYGGGYGGYGYGGDGGGSGGGDGGGDGGGSEGARGDIRPVLASAPDMLDETYTPGNEPRHHDGSHGMWNATRTPDDSANPGSTGYASSGDPKEFRQDSSAFGRMGSIAGWPTIHAEGLGIPGFVKKPVQNLYNKIPDKVKGIGWGGGKDHGKDLRGGGVLPDSVRPGEISNAYTGKPPPEKDVGVLPNGTKIDNKNPVTRTVDKVENALTFYDGIGDFITDRTWDKNDPKAKQERRVGPVTEAVDGVSRGTGWVSDKGQKAWKSLFGSLNAEVTAALRAEGLVDDLLKAPLYLEKGIRYGDDIARGVGRAADDIGEEVAKGWDNLPDWMPGAKAPVKPAAPSPRKPGDGSAKAAPKAPDDLLPKRAPITPPKTAPDPVPMKPGTAKPGAPAAKPDSDLAPKMSPSTPKGKVPASGLDAAPAPKPGAGSGKMNATPKAAPKASPKGKARPRGRGFIPDLPQFQRPDYYRQSEQLIGEMGIGSRRSAAQHVADLLQQEALLDEEPEAALPTTDGVTEDMKPATASLAVTEDVEDIVARFQATAGAAALAGGGSSSPGEGGDDVAAAARAFLSKESMKSFSPAEQKQIIDEGMDVTASNLDRLNIEGTHYAQLEQALAKEESLGAEDDDLW